MKIIKQGYYYLLYLFKSFHLHGIHSPFIYDIHQNIIKDVTAYYCFDEIEMVRKKLRANKKLLRIQDLGVGGSKKEIKTKRIRQIAKNSLKSPKAARLIFRLGYRFQPKTILELGTSLGVTTAYLAKACPSAKIISIEGAAEVSKIAAINLEKLNISNVELQVGSFEDKLEAAIKSFKKLDFVFFDGNHRKTPTLNYFKSCLKAVHEESIFIFDDIYWSTEMKVAWDEIKAHPQVCQSIDIYDMGIIFFRNDQAKEHFTIYQ